MATIQQRSSGDGETSWHVRVRLKGYPTQTATFARKTDAKRWAQHTEAAIREGRYFKTPEARRRTLAELIDRYLEQVLPVKRRRADAKERTRALNDWKAELGAYLLAEVTPARIIEVRDQLRAKGAAPATVNRRLAALSHAFTVAVREWQWLDANPVGNVSRLPEPPGRTRFLSDEERPRLLKACQASQQRALYPIVVLALATGMRRGEILGLTWEDVDTARRTIHLKRTKNGDRRLVPLTGHALAVMQEYAKVRRLDSPRVFPGTNPDKPLDFWDAWAFALKRAKITNFRFHDLRHSAASYLAMSGCTPVEIAAVLGHRTLEMVKRYAHVADAHTAAVVERMNGQIFGNAAP